LLFFSLCSSTLPLWLSISSAFLKQWGYAGVLDLSLLSTLLFCPYIF
jgi:hypothetical protein